MVMRPYHSEINLKDMICSEEVIVPTAVQYAIQNVADIPPLSHKETGMMARLERGNGELQHECRSGPSEGRIFSFGRL